MKSGEGAILHYKLLPHLIIVMKKTIKHLYIIGNGFDLFTGLKSGYSDFKCWLENNYPTVYENMQNAYDMDGEWWNDFEVQLGKLDVKTYINKFTPSEKTEAELLRELEERKSSKEKYDLLQHFQVATPCANRLRGLLDILQYCFEKWVEDCQRSIPIKGMLPIEKENSVFINLNYTDVLQQLYKIPEEQVLHIHGRASKHERLVFGHNTHLYEGGYSDEDKTRFELACFEKNPYEHIYKHIELYDDLKDVEHVHVYGFSFSEVDEDYVDWIYNHVPVDSHWEISWHTSKDLKRIASFIEEYSGLNERIKLVRLNHISDTPGSLMNLL